MLKKFAKEYFSFTRKERNAVIVLSCLITVILLLPYLVPDKQVGIDESAVKEFELQLARLKTEKADTARHSEKGLQKGGFGSERLQGLDYSSNKSELFHFDPNTLSIQGWIKLGVSEKTSRTIQNYLAKGGKFRRAEDIGKIYGMREEQVARLLPYVKLEQQLKEGFKGAHIRAFEKSTEPLPPYQAAKSSPRLTVDINTGDSSAFIALPGIGSKLALRIINFRTKLGGFYAVDQISEVYGLPDSTFQRIKQRLTLAPRSVTVLNLNTASGEDLKQHPYLKQNLAGAIIQYRVQHGNFNDVEDLRKIDIVTPEVFEKVSPYLTVK